MNKKSLQIIVAILSLNLVFSANLFAQDAQRVIRVIDENGNPVSGAAVLIGEGSKQVLTNDQGEFAMPDSMVPVFIEADGLEPFLINAIGSAGLEEVILEKAPYQAGEKDNIQMPFGSSKMRHIPGAVTALSPKDILKYDNTTIEDVLLGRIPGLFGSNNIRGLGNPLIVIDGIPRQSATLNLQQVEHISVLKDLSTAMMYGSQATNGVILITTKRGEPLKKKLNFTVENGFNKPISYPNYLNAGDYMELYNEALSNDGLAPKFTSDLIANTRAGSNTSRYPDEGYYNSKYLNDWSSYQNFVGEASGGNEMAQYYLNIGWKRNDGLLKIGEGADEKNDRLNVHSNINYKLTDVIHLRFDGAVVFDINKAPRYTDEDSDFWTLASTLHPEYYSVLIPSNLITDATLLGAAKLTDDQYVLGGTSEYLTNMYGELTRNGPSRINERSIQLNTGLDFDLASVTEGLSASVYFSFDMNSMFRTEQLNSYAVYNPSYDGDSISFSKYGVDSKVDEQSITDVFYYRRTGIFGTLDYDRSFGDHDVKVTALAYRDEYSEESILQPTKHLNFGVRANYIFQNKFSAELTSLVSGSSKLYETDPYTISPGVGFGWIISEENFMKDISAINYFKLRTNWALVKSDENITESYLGRDLYAEGNVFYYNHGLYDNSTRILSTGNPDLGWEKAMNFNVGFESMLFDYKIGIEGSYFYNKSYDLLSQRSSFVPVYYSSLPFENFESTQRQGLELGINYSTKIGDLEVKIDGNLVYSVPKVLLIDEPDYPDEYRKQTGKSSDAIFGFVALGLFENQEDIDNSTYQAFGEVQPGDIKYDDLNDDNIINNDDQMMIGNSSAKLGFGLTVNIKYKALSLFAMGYGQSGQNTIFDDPYYWVYGNRKYSEIVRDRWTPETATTATYPRLSSKSNANNFVNSTYWLYDNNWFRLQTVQLSYTIQTNGNSSLDEFRIFLRTNNLIKISKIKERTDLNVDSAPQTRALSLGVALQF